MPKCTHKGCEKDFDEDQRQDNECQYHPGAPVFHEGLKGWSCCKKRVDDFDEFLKIEGCTHGRHSTEKPSAPTKPVTAKAAAPTATKDGIEVYGSATATPPPAPVQKAIPAVEAKTEEAVEAEEEEDDESLPVPPQAECKRRGCSAKYKDDATSRGDGEEAKCFYHPREPIFHEGSKGYICCKRRVLEFDEFLKIKGCKEGKHLFVGSNKGSKEEMIDCRTDWYQTQTDVIFSIFAKNRIETKIDFEEKAINVDIKLKDNKRYKKRLPLFQAVEVGKCASKELSTKVEITLKKTSGISWASFEPDDNVKSWTTFGTTGQGGTVGSKEMHYVADSPLNMK